MGALDVPVLGLNCATGPKEMAEHIRHLGQAWPGPDLGPAQCRPAGAALRPPALSSGSRRACPLARALPPRGRREHRRRLLRHGCGAYRRHRFHAAPDRRGRLPAAPEAPPAGLGPVAGLPLLGRAPAPGERLSCHRRALQRQRLEEVQGAAGGRRLGRLRRHGQGAGPRGQSRARCLHRLCRPRRGERHARGDLAHARPGRCAPGDQFDRAARPGERPGALWRQGDLELDQLRGRGGAGRAADDAGQEARQCGDRAHHRRGGHGEDGGGQAPRRPPPGRLRLRPLRPAAIGPADRPAHLHRLHRQRGRPQAGPVDARRDRGAAGRVPAAADHPGPLQHLLRSQRRGPARPELGDARPRHQARPHRGHRPQQQDHAAAQDPGGGSTHGRGPDLRPPS